MLASRSASASFAFQKRRDFRSGNTIAGWRSGMASWITSTVRALPK